MTLVDLLWAILVIAVVVWVLGLLLNFGGSLIHLLLVLAVIVLLYNLFTRGRTTV